jgi:PAS domain S-box-containing protein
MTRAGQTRKQILVVEDEGLIAADVQRRLERLGYSVPAIAQSGEEALRCARSTPFDLVLMDIRIKGDMDGIAVAAALRAECGAPVLYMTAHSDQASIDRATVTEPFGYVLKPVGDANLRSAVQIAIYKSEMERRLRSSEAWLAATLGSVGDGIIATNTDGEIVFMNSVAEQLTSWSSGDAQGRQLMNILGLFEDSEARPVTHPVFGLCPAEKRSCTLISRKGLRLPVEVEWFENRSGDRLLGSVVAIRDIRARQEMEGRLLQSQRMEAISSMAGRLAHEFNNQLMVILGYAEELADKLPDEGRQEALAIKLAASVASSLSSQLLTLSCRDAVPTEVLNIQDAICEMQPMLSHTLGNTRHLTTDLGPSAAFIRGNPNQLRQVLLNLTLNARDAMEGGGELRIESRTVEIAADSAEGRRYRPGQYARLRFVDSGAGMDKTTLARIFEPFFTTKKFGRGSGLGLSIVHSIVVQSGGYISATSEPGAGSTFEMLLPSIGTFKRMSDIAGPLGAGGDAVPTILLVDDEDSVRKLLHGYLAREGFQVLEAGNAEEALLIAEVYREPIHVLVTDVVMPAMTGPQLAEQMTPVRPDMKVLFVSGYAGPTLAQHSLDLSANLLPKPFPAAELLRRVRLLLAQPASGVR